MRTGRTVQLIAAGMLAALGCGQPEPGPDGAGDERLRVVCTTGMIADMASEIGGERVAVTGLMGPGVDPHYYKATQGDLRHLTEADVVFYNGLFLEGKLDDIFQKMARDKTVVPVTRDVPESRLRRPPEFHGSFDPHVWFDVSMWQAAIDVVAGTLAESDPEGAVSYHANAEVYRVRLDSLHNWVAERIGQIDPDQRVLVTAHDAFGYFGRAYGMEVVALQGISTVAEYGVNDVSRLVELISTRRLRAIFVESSVPERSINAVREGCLARGHGVAIGGTLYSDAMGAPGSGADTYVGMVQTNVNTIAEALR